MDWSNKTVLVTGASGFKGSWLCGTLIRLGARVFGTVSRQTHPLSAFRVDDLDRKIRRLRIDVANQQQVDDVLNAVDPDVIFHLAAKALVPVSLRDPRRTYEVNVMGTINILEACRKFRVCKRLLVCSTDHVFGNVAPEKLPESGFPETERVSYWGPYDTSKSAMELVVRSYHRMYWNELPTIGITRCANVFGFGDVNGRRVLPMFTRWAIADQPIELKYRDNGRQFIHVSDAVRGYIKAAAALDDGGSEDKQGKVPPEKRSPFTQTFHFAIEKYEGTDKPYARMEDVAGLVSDVFKARVDDSEAVPYAKNENEVQALDCSATKEAIGWVPEITLRRGVEELGDWYRNLDERTELIKLLDGSLEGIADAVQRGA